MGKRQCVSSADAVDAKGQHKKPCSDCPWARNSLAGWLGGSTPEEWVAEAHSDNHIDCHTLKGAQCAGAAIYRANVIKSPRNPEVLRLPPDGLRVFRNPNEFVEHHSKPETKLNATFDMMTGPDVDDFLNDMREDDEEDEELKTF